MTWQPIDTAPRDGTQVLATIPVYDNARHMIGWQFDIICFDREHGEILLDAYRGWDWDDYTHWMPLPEPPKDTTT